MAKIFLLPFPERHCGKRCFYSRCSVQSFPVINRPECEAVYKAEVHNAWTFNSIPFICFPRRRSDMFTLLPTSVHLYQT